ncbi:MAG: beta-phosphoglucomutase, partial [Microcystaceae cyanobacterium]
MDASVPFPPFSYTDWTLLETQFDPERLHHKETVFTIGNGYLGTRGSFEEGYPRAWSSTLIHGVYDDVPVMYTELANCPDWLPLLVSIGGERFHLDQGEVLSYERRLDLKRGILSRNVRWRSPNGKTIDLSFERFASLANEHVLGLRCQITPLDYDGPIKVSVSINGYAENQGFNHWESLDQGEIDRGIWLHVRTRNSRIELGMATGLRLSGAQHSLQVTSVPGYPTLETTFSASAGQTVILDKVVTIYTSREGEAPDQNARNHLTQLPAYADLLAAHEQAWEAVWQQSDISIEGDIKAQLAVRYNLFQLLI